jgi:hypothetical protein
MKVERLVGRPVGMGLDLLLRRARSVSGAIEVATGFP